MSDAISNTLLSIKLIFSEKDDVKVKNYGGFKGDCHSSVIRHMSIAQKEGLSYFFKSRIVFIYP